ncbi:hypothetical protein [Pseudomonas sp. PA15(2017)]|uniref:hypothetical protein n=1 Tax=Pseudomonas sp. PA15(2017) TaxID=1932111 RepID=UPI00117A0351|nr:hypothetical protein [Pseudomonas sp. PA15(2017)]
MEVGASEAIAFLSLITSVGAVIFAKQSNEKANAIAQENLSLQHAMVELEISQSIENAKSKINEIALIMVPFVAKEKANALSSEDVEALSLYRKNFNAATQTLINYYDSACSKYADGKVDKIRFRKTYKTEIRRLVENEDLQEYFNPLTSSYKPILNIYKEWEHLE